MSATISITETQLLTALRAFLLTLVNAEVIRSQQNRVAMPTGDFVVMTPLFTTGLSTDLTAYQPGSSNPGVESHSRATQWNVQLDCYGPSASDNANLIATMIRTDYACQQFLASGIDIQPLYAGEPKQSTMINAEQQFENRWTVDFVAQYNPVVKMPQDFANTLTIIPAEVDVTFPP